MLPQSIAVTLVVLMGFNALAQPAAKEISVKVGNTAREAIVYPSAAKGKAPLVFVFHGHGGTSEKAAKDFHIQKLWPDAITVYMQGQPIVSNTDPAGKTAGWQHEAGELNDRDFKFFDQTLARVKKDYKVDPDQIYATGHSNGGGFTYLHWANRGDILAAFAPSSATATEQGRERSDMTASLAPMFLFAALAQAAPDVIVDTVSGPRAAAPLLAIEPEFTIKLGGKTPATVAGRDLVALRRVGVAQPELCAPPFVLLTTGDRLPLATPLDVRLEDEALHAALAAPLAGKVRLPQAAVAAVALAASENVADKQTDDVVILQGGDRMHGTLGRLDAKGAHLTVGDKHVEIPLARIAKLAFNPEFLARPRPAEPFAEVHFRGGARVSFTSLATRGPGGEIVGETLLGNKLPFAADDLVALRVRNGAAVYLDDLKPSAYESTPFLDLTWPLAVGRTLRGGPLRLSNNTYQLGVAMHSKSRASYPLAGGFVAFEALVGVDESAGPRGAVAIDVAVDGRPVPDIARVLRAGDAPTPIRVDLKGAKTLTLLADFGPRGDVQSHVLWIDARLLRAK